MSYRIKIYDSQLRWDCQYNETHSDLETLDEAMFYANELTGGDETYWIYDSLGNMLYKHNATKKETA